MQSSNDTAFLASYDSAVFPKPSVTVDVVLLAIRAEALQVLLVRRPGPPEAGRWALPGGFESPGEGPAPGFRRPGAPDEKHLERLGSDRE